MFGQDYIDSLMQRFGMSEDELADYIMHSGAKSDDEVLSGLIRNRGADNAFIQGNFTGDDAAAKAAFNAKVIADRKDRLRRHNKGAVPSYKAESPYTKRAREAIVQGVSDIDPLLQLGLLNSVYGDNDILQMYNTNKQSEAQRQADAEREAYVKAVEDAENKKTKSFEEAKTRKEALTNAMNEAEKAYSLIYDNSNKGKNYADVSDIDWTNLQIARDAVDDAEGDTTKFDKMLKNKPSIPQKDNQPNDGNNETPPKSTKENIEDLIAEKERILNSEKPKSSDKAAVQDYNAKIEAFNEKLKGLESDIQNAVKLIEQDKKVKYVAPKSFDPMAIINSTELTLVQKLKILTKENCTYKKEKGKYKVYNQNGRYVGDLTYDRQR